MKIFPSRLAVAALTLALLAVGPARAAGEISITPAFDDKTFAEAKVKASDLGRFLQQGMLLTLDSKGKVSLILQIDILDRLGEILASFESEPKSMRPDFFHACGLAFMPRKQAGNWPPEGALAPQALKPWRVANAPLDASPPWGDSNPDLLAARIRILPADEAARETAVIQDLFLFFEPAN